MLSLNNSRRRQPREPRNPRHSTLMVRTVLKVVNKENKPVIAGEKVVFVSEIKEVKMKEVKLNNTTLDLAKIMLQANSSYLEEKKYKTNENKVKDVK